MIDWEWTVEQVSCFSLLLFVFFLLALCCRTFFASNVRVLCFSSLFTHIWNWNFWLHQMRKVLSIGLSFYSICKTDNTRANLWSEIMSTIACICWYMMIHLLLSLEFQTMNASFVCQFPVGTLWVHTSIKSFLSCFFFKFKWLLMSYTFLMYWHLAALYVIVS